MSTALGTDMSSASIQLGKALNNPIAGLTALSRAGVSFTEEQKNQIRTLVETGDVLGAQKLILAELSKEFGGAAEAAATPVDKLRVKLGNLQEDVGAALIPIVSGAADVVSKLTDAFIALPGPVKTVVEILGVGGAGSMGAIVVVSKLASVFGDSLKPVMDFARRQFDDVALAVGNMATKMGASQEAGANIAGALSGAVAPALGAVAAAAVVGFGMWTMYQQGQQEAATAAKAFKDTLDAQTGAITANSQANIEKTLTDRNQIDNLNNAKISTEAFSAAIADNSHKLGLSTGLLWEYTNSHNANSRTRQMAIDKLREEGGARNEMIATLIEEGQLDAGLLRTIMEKTKAYDAQQKVIHDKIVQQGIANGKTEAEVEVEIRAANANRQHADELKNVADELRAQTDPYFAAWRSQQQLTEANANYAKVVADGNKTEDEKKAAWMAAAQAAISYKGDLLGLEQAAKTNGATTGALQSQLGDLSKFGLDTTGTAAKRATYDLMLLGANAEEVGKKEVNIPVDLEMSKVKARLDWLRSQANQDTGFVPLEALYAVPFAKGGMVGDGMFVVGEQGPELGYKQGAQVRIFSNPDSQRMVSSNLVGTAPARASGDVNVYVNQPNSSAYEIGRELRWQMAVTR